MKKLILKKIASREDISREALIRYKVFVIGQKVPEKLEIDGHEDSCEHFLGVVNGRPVGCIRIRPVGRRLKLERLAVLEEFRGKGHGKEIVRLAVARCKRRRPAEIYMNAQYYLLDFYKSLGFLPRGRIFSEAGIRHVQMFLK